MVILSGLGYQFDTEESRGIKMRESNENVEMTFDGGLFKTFKVPFPHSSAVEVVVAFSDVGVVVEGRYQLNSTMNLQVRKLPSLLKWVRLLAIRKIISNLGIGERVESSRFSNLDGVVCQHQKQQFCIYPEEQIPPLATSSTESNRQKAKRCWLNILADYHCENIVLGEIAAEQLRWAEGRGAVLRITECAEVALYDEGHWQWMEQRNDPYARDRSQLELALAGVGTGEGTVTSKEQQSLDSRDLLLEMDLLVALNSSSYFQFKTTYQSKRQRPFLITQNQALTSKIREYYELGCRREDLKVFLEQHLQESKGMIGQHWEALPVVEELLSYRSFLQLQNSSQSPTLASLLEHFKTNELNYYRFYAQSGGVGGKGQLTFQDLLEKMSMHSDKNVFLWHFLKSKIENRQGKHYRALAHLRQAAKLTEERSLLGILQLEEGRSWEFLGHHSKAEKCYCSCKQHREQAYGTMHPLVLPPLYNLLQLSIKQNHKEQAHELREQIEAVCGKWSKEQVLEWGELRLGWTVEQFQSEREERRIGAKQVLMKVQSARMPKIGELWHISRQLFQKNKKEAVPLAPSQPYFTTFCGPSAILLVSSSVLKPIIELNPSQLPFLDKVLFFLSTSHMKNYHRLLFCLSFVWEEREEWDRAIGALRVISESARLYSKAVQLSIQRRWVQLLRRGQRRKQMFDFYLSNDITKREDMEGLFHCLKVFEEEQEDAKCVRLAQYYLAHIHQYPTQSEDHLGDGKLVDHSFSVRVILLKAFLRLRNYQSSADLLKLIEESSEKVQEVAGLLELFVEQAVEGEEWILGWWALQKLLGWNQKEKRVTGESYYYVKIVEKDRLWRWLEEVLVGLKVERTSRSLQSDRPSEKGPDSSDRRNWQELKDMFHHWVSPCSP